MKECLIFVRLCGSAEMWSEIDSIGHHGRHVLTKHNENYGMAPEWSEFNK